MIKVLIDDDILIQLGWELKAEKENYQVDSYSNVDDFLIKSNLYSKKTPIFIGPSSQIRLQEIKNAGFENIIFINEKIYE